MAGSLLAAIGLLGAGIGVGSGLVAAVLFEQTRDFNGSAFLVDAGYAVLGVLGAVALIGAGAAVAVLSLGGSVRRRSPAAGTGRSPDH